MVRRPAPKKQTVTYVRRPRRKRQGEIYNLLSALLFLLTVCFLSWFLYLYNFPESSLNPFPPLTPSLPPTIEIILPKASATTASQLSTAAVPAVENTPIPEFPNTDVPAPTLPGPTPVDGSLTETPVPAGYYSYAAISAPSVIQASTLMSDRGCDWLGVGGNVTDIQSRPATGILVQMGGYLGKAYRLDTSLSGTALQYGQAGFEFTLSDKPVNSKHTLWVRVVDQALQPLSDKVYFDTFADCGRNLVLVNFKQIK